MCTLPRFPTVYSARLAGTLYYRLHIIDAVGREWNAGLIYNSMAFTIALFNLNFNEIKAIWRRLDGISISFGCAFRCLLEARRKVIGCFVIMNESNIVGQDGEQIEAILGYNVLRVFKERAFYCHYGFHLS